MGNRCLKISWIALLLWMGLIFYLSSQPGDISGELSMGITETVLRYIEQWWPTAGFDAQLIHHFIRKNAHFIAYLLLGLLAINAVSRSGWLVAKAEIGSSVARAGSVKQAGIALLFCVLYAASDEFHQLFVPGRSGQFSDVLIDSAGSVTGILLFLAIHKSYVCLFKSDKHSCV